LHDKKNHGFVGHIPMAVPGRWAH